MGKTPMPNLICSAVHVMEQHQCRRVDMETGHLVPDGRHRRGKVSLLDAQTASVLQAVWEGLNEENRSKFADVIIPKGVAATIDFCWRVVSPADKEADV